MTVIISCNNAVDILI